MTTSYGLQPDRCGRLILPDGRTLAWYEWGQRGGTPVLFCPGAGMSGTLGFGHEHLDALGVRLIAVDRPGLGGSSPDPAKSFSSWVADVRALLSALGVVQPSVVGFSQGAPFALALGAASLSRAIALVSGQDDFSHTHVAKLLPSSVSGMVRLAHERPATLEAEVAAVANAEWLFELVVDTSSSLDRAFYMREDFAAAYGRCLAEGFAQGVEGYVKDLHATFGPWPFSVEEVQTPVDLWYGVHDTSTVHSPDFGATLAMRLPHASRTVVSDAGGALLWTHALPILTRLLGHTSEEENRDKVRSVEVS